MGWGGGGAAIVYPEITIIIVLDSNFYILIRCFFIYLEGGGRGYDQTSCFHILPTLQGYLNHA